MWLVIKYAAFALVAMAANLGVQMLVTLAFEDPSELWVSMGAGTLVGLLLKFFLDKRYIFYYQPGTKAQETRRFFRYSLMGVATTLIFWAFEAGFDWIFGTLEMRYLGAAIGLTIGYITKYHLDKRLVFTKA